MRTLAGALPCPARVVIANREYGCQREHHPTRQLHTRHVYERALRGGGELRLRWNENLDPVQVRGYRVTTEQGVTAT